MENEWLECIRQILLVLGMASRYNVRKIWRSRLTDVGNCNSELYSARNHHRVEETVTVWGCINFFRCECECQMGGQITQRGSAACLQHCWRRHTFLGKKWRISSVTRFSVCPASHVAQRMLTRINHIETEWAEWAECGMDFPHLELYFHLLRSKL